MFGLGPATKIYLACEPGRYAAYVAGTSVMDAAENALRHFGGWKGPKPTPATAGAKFASLAEAGVKLGEARRAAAVLGATDAG